MAESISFQTVPHPSTTESAQTATNQLDTMSTAISYPTSIDSKENSIKIPKASNGMMEDEEEYLSSLHFHVDDLETVTSGSACVQYKDVILRDGSIFRFPNVVVDMGDIVQ